MNEESLFAAASALPPGTERTAFLERECGENPELRARLKMLLAAHDAGPGMLDREGAFAPTLIRTSTSEDDPVGRVGALIAGRYKLLERIGEGGMGTVWVADQMQPVRRKVALKLIKAGMDSRSVIARFEAERQALALMDHPNIAKVLDGGMTEQGRPYFAMEYVKGVPLTQYCDDARLTVEERLQLFIPVCQAVQHAHQKGIIHRDLKPTNILICLYDGKPVPKVIDFGLAKAMHQSLTEHTVYTSHGMMLGTPLYMSPEQAELNNLDIDTRSDVYALGVVLYELLTGTTPLEKLQLQTAAWQEIVRLIKEVEPQRPSTRLSSSGSLPSIAAQRRLEPLRLSRLLKRDLDWIVMKALEKDRNRRYSTPLGLASDLDRYLQGDVVEARPPSVAYRWQRLFSRHRTLMLTGTAVCVGLIAAVIVFANLAIRARRAELFSEEKRLEAEQANAALQRSLDETRSARREAERLTGQVVAAGVSAEVDEITLLHWAGQLPQLTDGAGPWRDFFRLCLLGGQQFLATYENRFGTKVHIHAFEQGLMAFSREEHDLAAYDLKTGRRILQERALCSDIDSIKQVICAGPLILACDSSGRVTAFARDTGEQRYAVKIHDAGAEWDQIQVNPRRTMLVSFGQSAAAHASRLAFLETHTGTVVEVPVPGVREKAIYNLSSSGAAVAVVVPDAHQIELRRTRDGALLAEISLGDREAKAVAFAPDDMWLAVSSDVPQRGDKATSAESKVQLWNPKSKRVDWEVAPASAGVFWLAPRILGDDQGTWTFDEKAVGEPQRVAARRFTQPARRADADWIVAASGEVFRRSDFRRDDPLPSRAYSTNLRRFAVRERYLWLNAWIIDLETERSFPGTYWNRFEFDPDSQRVMCGNPGYFEMILPVDPNATSDDEIRELSQLVACGELDSHGIFSPWTESQWNTRFQESRAHGWLEPGRYPHLSDYLEQSAYWRKHRMRRLMAESPAENTPENRAAFQKKLEQAWDDLLAHDDTLATQVEFLKWFSSQENVVQSELLAREKSLVLKYGPAYFRAQGVTDDLSVAEYWCYALLAAGNEAMYREECARQRERYAASEVPRKVLALGRILIFSPQAVNDHQWVVELGQKAVRLDPLGWWPRHVLAGAYLRNGQYADVLKTLDELNQLKLVPEPPELDSWLAPILNDSLRAIALANLGRTSEATAVLEGVRKLSDEHPPATPGQPFGESTPFRWNWFPIQAFRREAEELLRAAK